MRPRARTTIPPSSACLMLTGQRAAEIGALRWSELVGDDDRHFAAGGATKEQARASACRSRRSRSSILEAQPAGAPVAISYSVG